MEKFTFFWSGSFSNWYPASFEVKGVWYNCSEQMMMAEKARLFNDNETLAMIMSSVDPSEQKRYGRQVKGFDKNKWEKVAKEVVFAGCLAKFTQNPEHKKKLLATAGTTLVEASPEGGIWGIKLRKDDPRAQNRATWRGLNWLGEVLTEVREYIIRRGL